MIKKIPESFNSEFKQSFLVGRWNSGDWMNRGEDIHLPVFNFLRAHEESNLDFKLRKLTLYPLSYGRLTPLESDISGNDINQRLLLFLFWNKFYQSAPDEGRILFF